MVITDSGSMPIAFDPAAGISDRHPECMITMGRNPSEVAVT